MSQTSSHPVSSGSAIRPTRLLVYLTLGDDLLPDESVPDLDRRLLAQAVALCEGPELSVHILHVIEVDSDDPAWQLPETEQLFESESERARGIMERDLLPMMGAARERCTISVAAGVPVEEILRTAREQPCDLIVLGAVDPRGLERVAERFLHRGTAGRLLRTSEFPVCLLDPAGFADGSADLRPRRVLVPVDFSPVSALLVRQAEVLCEKFKCELYLLHALRLSLQHAFKRFPDRGYKPDEYEKELIASAEQKARELLGNRYDAWTVLLYQDRLASAVTAVVAEYKIDFMVLAGISRTRSGLAGALLGTNAEKILATTHTPAWVIKPVASDA